MSFESDEFDMEDPGLVSALDDLPVWSAPFGMKLLETVEPRPDMKVLDIGSGSGFPAIELSQRLGSTCKVYCIDPWKEASLRIREKVAAWGINNVEVLPIGAETLPFEDESFDLVTSNNGINNVDDDQRVMTEISRVSRRNAQMVISINLPGTMIEFYDIFRKLLERRGISGDTDRIGEHIYEKRKPLEYTLGMITGSGFEVMNVYRDSFRMNYCDGTAMLNHPFIRLAFLPSWKRLAEGSGAERFFDGLQEELNRVAEEKGFLSLTVPWACIDSRKREE